MIKIIFIAMFFTCNMRPDVYTAGHKGLRNALMNLQYQAGRTHFGNIDEVNELHQEMTSLWDLLDFHAEGEDELIHPHLKDGDEEVYNSLETEHDELVKVEQGLMKELEELKIMEAEKRIGASVGFVKRLNDYIARYLLHTQREELEAMPVLWETLSDEEILKIIGDFPKKASPEVLQYFLKYMIPAVNPLERTGMLQGMKANLPEPAFNNVMKIAEDTLSGSEYTNLQSALA